MDSLTHIALGGCIGEAFLGKKLGKRALALGAVAQSVPDIDFVTSFWMNPADNLLAHRGFTHSILFAAMISFLLALIAEKWHRPHNIPLKKWILFFFVQCLIHLLLDGFNVYGVGWLEPFSHQRFSFNTIFVADPLFSIWPAVVFIALLFAKRNNKRRPLWWVSGILATTFYLLYTVNNKITIDRTAKKILQQQQVQYTDYFSTPTPLNSWLWYIVAKNDSGYYTGYRSIFDTAATMQLYYFPKNASLLVGVANHETVQKLIRFSKGYYTVEQRDDMLVFNDLRFGQVIGWVNPREEFVFHYYLKETADNRLVMQRGRFAKWDKSVALALLKRIQGN